MFAFFKTKIGLSLLVAILIIGTSLALKYKNTERTAVKSTTTLALEKVVQDSLERDDDEDGLKNWEEILYKTDAKLADTDGDGTNDGDETALNQDPTIAGKGNTNTTATQSTSTVVTYTATDRLSQEIFKTYIQAKQQGKEIDENMSQMIADAVLSRNYEEISRTYTIDNLKTNPSSTNVSLRTYGNAVGFILNTPEVSAVNEIEIFSKLSTGAIEDYEADLIKIKGRYASMQAKFLALPAPKGFAPAQILLINSLSTFIDSIDGALSLESDPVGAVGRIGRYQDGVTNLSTALNELKKLFILNKTGFSPNEAGYIFAQ